MEVLITRSDCHSTQVMIPMTDRCFLARNVSSNHLICPRACLDSAESETAALLCEHRNSLRSLGVVKMTKILRCSLFHELLFSSLAMHRATVCESSSLSLSLGKASVRVHLLLMFNTHIINSNRSMVPSNTSVNIISFDDRISVISKERHLSWYGQKGLLRVLVPNLILVRASRHEAQCLIYWLILLNRSSAMRLRMIQANFNGLPWRSITREIQ